MRRRDILPVLANASSGNQNPSLTCLALSARAAHSAVEALQRGEL